MSKKRFLIFGFLNVLVTNILLQILLIYFQISIATLISQIIGMFFGFFIYGKFVFNNKSLTILKLVKYVFSTLLIWIFNGLGFISYQ